MSTKDIDVVLMDINLHGMDGIECMKLLIPIMLNSHFMMSTVYDDYIYNAPKLLLLDIY